MVQVSTTAPVSTLLHAEVHWPDDHCHQLDDWLVIGPMEPLHPPMQDQAYLQNEALARASQMPFSHYRCNQPKPSQYCQSPHPLAALFAAYSCLSKGPDHLLCPLRAVAPPLNRPEPNRHIPAVFPYVLEPCTSILDILTISHTLSAQAMSCTTHETGKRAMHSLSHQLDVFIRQPEVQVTACLGHPLLHLLPHGHSPSHSPPSV